MFIALDPMSAPINRRVESLSDDLMELKTDIGIAISIVLDPYISINLKKKSMHFNLLSLPCVLCSSYYCKDNLYLHKFIKVLSSAKF